MKENNIKDKLIDIDFYFKYFEMKDIIKGNKIYNDSKIGNLKIKDNTYSCIVSGTKDYDVIIKFDENNDIKEMNCTCPHFKNGNNCKHLYALLIESKLKDNYPKLILFYMNKRFNDYKEKIDSMKIYFNNNMFKYSNSDRIDVKFFIHFYGENRIERFNEILKKDLTSIEYLSVVKEIDSEIESMQEDFMKIKSKEQVISYNRSKKSKKQKNGFGSVLFGLVSGVVCGLSAPSPQKKREENTKKWALEELKKGNSEPYISEYNELEDDMFQDYE